MLNFKQNIPTISSKWVPELQSHQMQSHVTVKLIK